MPLAIQPFRSAALVVACGLALAGCAVGPKYERPAVETPAAFKEGEGTWVQAAPADALQRGAWWELFKDPELNDLMAKVEVSNNNVAVSVARYAQARALVAQQRASLFPTVNLGADASRSGARASNTSTVNTQSGTLTASGSGITRNSYSVNIGATWEPDVWGRLRAGVNEAQANAQASEADLQAATLSAQGELATDYFNLRLNDVSLAIQAQTIAGYERSLQITQNRYNAAIAAKTDVLQAQTQLANAQADELSLRNKRAALEHAIAVLVGRAPSDFSIAARPVWNATVPDIPASVPSDLLQRRPDIAGDERRVAAANEAIGIALAGYFPSLNLSANAGLGASAISELFNASALTWSLGASLAQTVFNAGATRAQVEGARAGLEAAAATYRQTVLTAFQGVEDQLVASHVLQQQLALRKTAADASTLAEQQVLNRYQAGQVVYTDVVTAQVTAASARLALAQATSDREVAAVALIQALGGGWHGLSPQGAAVSATP